MLRNLPFHSRGIKRSGILNNYNTMAEKSNPVTKRQLIALVVMGLVFLIALFLILNVSSPRELTLNTANSQYEKNTISVTGSYSADIDPDQSEIYLTVRTENPNAQTAQNNNREAANNVVNALKAQGLKKDDIETTGYNIQLIKEYDSRATSVIVTNSMKVKVKDLEKVGNVLDAAANSEASSDTVIEINNIQFTLSDEKQIEVNEALLSKASKNAKDKAEAIASSLGTSIISKPLSVSEGSVYIPYPYYAQGVRALSIEMEAPTPISPSPVKATATVNVVFEIS